MWCGKSHWNSIAKKGKWESHSFSPPEEEEQKLGIVIYEVFVWQFYGLWSRSALVKGMECGGRNNIWEIYCFHFLTAPRPILYQQQFYFLLRFYTALFTTPTVEVKLGSQQKKTAAALHKWPPTETSIHHPFYNMTGLNVGRPRDHYNHQG